MRYRHGWRAAEKLITAIRSGIARIEVSAVADLEVAATIGTIFADQDFSLSDRTSWAVMERLGIHDAISLDSDFRIYRFGPGRRRRFTVSPTRSCACRLLMRQVSSSPDAAMSGLRPNTHWESRTHVFLAGSSGSPGIRPAAARRGHRKHRDAPGHGRGGSTRQPGCCPLTQVCHTATVISSNGSPPGKVISMGNIGERLIHLVSSNIEVDGEALDIPSDLKVSLVNAGVSSMDIIALAKLVSREFNVEFTVEECVSLRTLREVVDFLDSKGPRPQVRNPRSCRGS